VKTHYVHAIGDRIELQPHSGEPLLIVRPMDYSRR
jgi:hypothetical protein